MTDLQERIEAVARMSEAVTYWADRHGYANARVRAADLRAILAALDALPPQGWDEAELRRAESEIEGAERGLSCLPEDFTALEDLWPLGKRGSRAQSALTRLKDRVEGIAAYVRDARAAMLSAAPSDHRPITGEGV